MGKIKHLLFGIGSLAFILSMAYPGEPVWAQGQPLTFSAYGDIPYGSGEYPALQQHITDHNRYSPSAFIVHIGDMLSGSCDESKYADFANFMRGLAVPAYIVVGDNEYSDCDDPVAALALWKKYFLTFGESFCGAPYTEHQSVRSENIAFTMNGVLFVGINLVGGSVHDQNEWNTRMQQDADWISQQFQAKVSQVRAAVVFAQTGDRSAVTTFTTKFRAAGAAFAKPVLYIHGDLHSYKFDQPWPEKNLTRLEVPKGSAEPPLEVTINMNTVPAQGMGMYTVKRNPWSGGQPYNMPPCVNAGSDQTIASLSTSLQGQVTDDGDPTGSLNKIWSKVSGPGTVTFGNANTLTTTASFGAAGTYVLRLTANDGQLQKSDEMTIVAQSSGPTPPPPTVSSFNPNNSPIGSEVTIVGSQFINVTNVAFNGTNATSFTINSDTQILATVPNGATTGKISVTNSGGVGVSADDFNVTAPSQYTLIVSTLGSGSVASNPSGGTYNSGTLVTLTATPAAGFQFSGWSGDLTGATNPATLTMNANKTVTATFTAIPPTQYTLTVNTSGSGSVALNPPGGTYSSGTTVTLTATPAAGFQFSGWSGDLTGATNPATLTMNANKTVTATFTAIPPTQYT
ncbi:MAG: InlB B-repeat-containing protein, partial [bacterium]